MHILITSTLEEKTMKSNSSSSPLHVFIATVLLVSGMVPLTNAQTEWTKHPNNPVLDVGSAGEWDDAGVSLGPVLFDGTSYHMWYLGNDGTIGWRTGYATSDDGITWTKDASNPVLEAGSAGSWDDSRAAAWSVILIEATYHMWYTGGDGSANRIGHATSLNGIDWTKDANNPVLDVGSTGSWDDFHVWTPAVVFDNTIYQMWYTGYDGSKGQIGYATSMDGISWAKKGTANPVLNVGSAGEWDDGAAYAPVVIVEDTTYHMWYIGNDGTTNERIGYATSVEPPNAIGHAPGMMPTSFLLHQNYPNPFNPVSMIRYELPQATFVSLVVYDILGRKVTSLIDGYMELGYHEAQWNGQEFPSGVYIARLVTPGYSKSIKMVLMK
jgi:hypothetical protein